jgi:hypothetical protein
LPYLPLFPQSLGRDVRAETHTDDILDRIDAPTRG